MPDPPAASPAGPAPSSAIADSRRGSTNDKGMPYYDKIRKDLREMLQRKKVLDRNLSAIEDQIVKMESAYLEDTPNGNIIRGFDNYIKGTAARRRTAISDSDRVFSLSSAASLKNAQQDDSSHNQSTSASTPTAEVSQKASLLKKKSIKRRKGEDESESLSDVETPGPKRVRISFSRQPT